MNIIHLSTTDSGGAGKFLFNLHKAFNKAGHQSWMVVRDKTSRDKRVVQLYRPLPVKFFYDAVEFFIERFFPVKTDRKYYFYNKREWFTKYPVKYILEAMPFTPDIILVGWVSGFVNFKTLYKLQQKTGAKIFFYFADMGNMTGNCHYDMFCNKYTTDCKDCPAIIGKRARLLAHRNLKEKDKYVQKMKPHIFPGTTILRKQTLKSFLYRNIEPFQSTNAPVNPDIFNQHLLHVAREVHGVRADKKIILMGSGALDEPRKGFDLLVAALQHLKHTHPDFINSVQLLIAGDNLSPEIISLLSGYDIVYLGFIHDEKLLSLAYQAADIYICPSVYDSGPLMLMESMMCGTPVVSFDVGVAPEFVINNYTGYKAENYDPQDLANGIYSVLNMNQDAYRKMREDCVQLAGSLCSETVMVPLMLNYMQSLISTSVY